jgi:hypothetical protein
VSFWNRFVFPYAAKQQATWQSFAWQWGRGVHFPILPQPPHFLHPYFILLRRARFLLTYHYTQPASTSFQSGAPAGAQHNLCKLTRPNQLVKYFIWTKFRLFSPPSPHQSPAAGARNWTFASLFHTSTLPILPSVLRVSMYFWMPAKSGGTSVANLKE